MVTSADRLIVMTSRMNDAVHFYQTVLGGELVSESPYWSLIRFPGIEIGLHSESNVVIGGPVIGLRVQNLLDAVTTLSEFGISAAEIHEIPSGRVVTISDPDGNRIQLVERDA